MAKEGLDGASVEAFLRDAARRTGWALCIGTGASMPAFPSWNMLVTRLVARDVSESRAQELAERLLSQFNPDSLIQGAYDRLALPAPEFVRILSEELYRDLRRRLTDPEWRLFSRAFSAYRPAHLSLSDWRVFLAQSAVHLGSTTGWSLACILARVIGTDLAPAAILSFNAEPMLFTLTTAMLVERDVREGAMEPLKGEMQQHLDLVNRSIAVRRVDRVPYLFCHGLLPVPDAKIARSHMQAVDKLVFSEATYLDLANLSFSWQSSAFLDVCASRRTVFVGVSLSDPNMRRWLGWLHSNRTAELTETSTYDGPATYHAWIRKTPPSDQEKRWIESSVAHLGIRLIWINDWTEVGPTLSRMLGLEPG